MECGKLVTIGVVGRQLNNPKWSTLFEVLDDAKENGYIEYNKYSLDNGKVYEGSDDKYLFFLATTPKGTLGKEFIQFPISSTPDDIAEILQGFSDKVFGDSGEPEPTNEEKYYVDATEFMGAEIKQSISDSTKVQKLEGIAIEVNNKTVTLNLEDADKLKELIELVDKQGFRVKDIIVTEVE